jgi:hypothetical protein
MKIDNMGDFTIQSYLRNEISPSLISFIHCETKKCFDMRRTNYNYKDNYMWDDTKPNTLAFKFKNNQFDIINLVFKNENFLSFSGSYINHNQIAFGGVRRFSTPNAPIAPYHMAYAIPVQLAYMKQLGAKAFVLSYNAGVRDGFFKLISRIAKSKNPKGIYQEAQQMYLDNSFEEHETPVLCNSVLQRLHYCRIDKSMNETELIKLLS